MKKRLLRQGDVCCLEGAVIQVKAVNVDVDDCRGGPENSILHAGNVPVSIVEEIPSAPWRAGSEAGPSGPASVFSNIQRIVWKRNAPLNYQNSDIVDTQTRSRMMSAVRQFGTKPELAIRKLLTEMGVRYRIKNRDLPGSPDLANRSRKWAIFVNGCFWHGHKFCSKTKSGKQPRVPKTRSEFWEAKLIANRSRDARKSWELRQLGFRVLIIWECDLKDFVSLTTRLERFANLRREHG